MISFFSPLTYRCSLVQLLLPLLLGTTLELSAQTVFRNASDQLPPEPTGFMDGLPTNTADADFIDIEGDGDLDVFITDGSSGIPGRPNRLLLNNGQGAFTDVSETNLPPSTNAPFGPGPANSVRADIGDIDQDGDPDIVIANLGNNQILLNDGTGVFTDASELLPPPPTGPLMGPLTAFNNISVDVGLLDVDQDGDLDIYFVNEIPPIPGVGPAGSPNLLYIQNEQGSFDDESASRLPSQSLATINFAAVDIDNDGDLDIVEANIGQNQILINDGNGFFTSETEGRLPADDTSTRALALGDLDQDGDLDLVTANSNAQQNQIFLNDGSGVFAEATEGRLPERDDTSSDVALFDIDYDGDLDILFANSTLVFPAPGAPPAPAPAPNALYLNDGTGVFTAAPDRFFPQTVNTSFEIEVGDLSGDGLADVFIANANNANEELFIRQETPPTPRIARQVKPTIECVQENEDGSFTAFFGYQNASNEAAYLPRGSRNRLAGFVTDDTKPPVVFLPGGTNRFPSDTFGVQFNFVAIWVLNGRTAVATRRTKRCDCENTTSEPLVRMVNVMPNPFEQQTAIKYVLGSEAVVQVQVYDRNGTLVATVVDKTLPEGEQQVTLEGAGLHPGIYHLRISATSRNAASQFSRTIIKH